MIDWTKCPAVESRPGKLAGAWVFRGSRVPVESLLSALERDLTVDDFLDQFDGVTREQVRQVLHFLAEQTHITPVAA